MRFITAICLGIVLCVASARAHEGQGGEPGHWDMQNGVKVWHTHGPSPEAREAQLKRNCAAARTKYQRRAAAWNRMEAKAYSKLQKTCADKSPFGKNACHFETRHYRANYSPAVAARNQKYWRGKIAEACGPPKSREEVGCEQLARAIEGARSRRNTKGVTYWTQRATEAGCS